MEYERYCEECGSNRVEIHHCIYRSQAGYLSNVPVNFKYLCPSCHRGNTGPHMNKRKDLQYKQELQLKLNQLFTKEFYTLIEIKELLNISKKEAEKVMNKTQLHKSGYSRQDIIKRCLRGRIYD